ncbi:hypothetical protein RRG08_015629 [Elysia crispata]|uniref:Uncharacterized protein n=1 Tax=Elysia crispata TaxID=231223 RepID=A0AAE0Y8V7_9GAST|nr:hypothetical protein RRG08_015629 [Elysia crispata]
MSSLCCTSASRKLSAPAWTVQGMCLSAADVNSESLLVWPSWGRLVHYWTPLRCLRAAVVSPAAPKRVKF